MYGAIKPNLVSETWSEEVVEGGCSYKFSRNSEGEKSHR